MTKNNNKPKSKNKPPYPPYKKRTDLSNAEKNAISHYKDLTNPQYKWDYKPEKGKCKDIGIDCYIVNSVLRGIIPKSALSKRDLNRFYSIVNNMSAAIEKSELTEAMEVIKGLSGSSWIEKYKSEDEYNEDAFGSYTTSKNIANKYAKKNKDGKKVFISQMLNKDSHALFVDNDECEYILPKGRRYLISRIREYKNNKIIYYIEEI